jgi:chemotaxis protein histidine kinase CheA
MAERPEKIQPPNRLSRKVRKKGGPSAEQAILRALNAAEDLIDNYQGWAVDDLTKLWKAYEESRNGGSPRDIQKMFEIAHGIRGEGGSFGFQLISTIGDSLCKFLEGRKKLTRADSEVVKVHILAMRAVFRQDLKGPQPAVERELRQLLALLRERVG